MTDQKRIAELERQLAEAQERIRELTEAGRNLYRTLARVQWGAETWDERPMCPMCLEEKRQRHPAHKADCRVGKALAAAAPWFGWNQQGSGGQTSNG